MTDMLVSSIYRWHRKILPWTCNSHLRRCPNIRDCELYILLHVYLPLVRVRIEPICGYLENAQGEWYVANMSKLSKA